VYLIQHYVMQFVIDLQQVNGFLWVLWLHVPPPIKLILDTTLCDAVCYWLATGQWFSLGTLVTCTSTNKTDGHDITESGAKHHNPNPDIIYESHW